MKRLTPLLLVACVFDREPPCATGYERDGSGECVQKEDDATNLNAGCNKVETTDVDFGCEIPEVVVTSQTNCIADGNTVVNLFETGVAGGRSEEHDMRQWNVDPAGQWEQLETVLNPNGSYARNLSTAFDCVVLGEPVITVVVRNYDLSANLIDCVIASNDPAGPDAVFTGNAPGQDSATAPDELGVGCETL